MPNNNAASRVRALLEEARQQPEEQQAGAAWAAVLDISRDRDPGHELWGQVAARLGLIHQELEGIRSQMRATIREPDLYEKPLDKAGLALGLGNLSALEELPQAH